MLLKLFPTFFLLLGAVNAFLLTALATYGMCQTGCNFLAVACYSAAGAVFGVTCGVAAGPAVIGCNVALGSCMSACAAATAVAAVTPTP